MGVVLLRLSWPHLLLIGGHKFPWYYLLQGRAQANLASTLRQWDGSGYSGGYILQQWTDSLWLRRLVSCIKSSQACPLIHTILARMNCYGSHVTFKCMDMDDISPALMHVLSRRIENDSRYLYVSGRSFVVVPIVACHFPC